MSSINSAGEKFNISLQQDALKMQAATAQSAQDVAHTSFEQMVDSQYMGVRSLLQSGEVKLFTAATKQTQNMKF